MPLPAARQTPNLEDQWSRTFQLPPPGVPHIWNDASEPQLRKVKLWARLPRILPKVANSTSLFGCFTWDRRFYFHSEGRRAEFFDPKIRRLRPGLNPRTWVPKASTLTPRQPKPLKWYILRIEFFSVFKSNPIWNETYWYNRYSLCVKREKMYEDNVWRAGTEIKHCNSFLKLTG